MCCGLYGAMWFIWCCYGYGYDPHIKQSYKESNIMINC